MARLPQPLLPNAQPGWLEGVALTAAGALINLLALTAPGATPLMLGNAAAYALAMRRLSWWALGAAAILGAIAGGAIWSALSVSVAALTWVAHRLNWSKAGTLLVPALPWMMWPAWKFIDSGNASDALLAALVLLLGHCAASLAASQLYDLVRPANERQDIGLAEQMSARLGIGTALPLCVLLLVMGQLVWRDRVEHQHTQLANYGYDLRVGVQRFLDARQRVIAFAADTTHLPEVLPDLRALSERFPGFLTLMVTDGEGQIVHFHAPEFAQFAGNVSDRDYFNEPRRSLQPFISRVFRGRGFGEDMLVAVSAAHRAPDGQFGGVVQGSLSLAQLDERLGDEARELRLDVVLADDSGQVLASSLDLAIGASMRQHPLFAPVIVRRGLVSDRGATWIVHNQRFEDSGWQLWTVRPVALLQKQTNWTNIGIALSCILILLLMTRLAGRFVQPQLAPLGELLGRIRTLDLNQPGSLQQLTTPAESREYRELRDDFGAMIARLVELYRELQSAVERGDLLNRELEERVRERTTALADALQRSERLAEAKSVFLANMSHELRTPLAAILGFAQRALAAPDSREQLLSALATINRNGRHLLDVLNDILDASRLDAGQLPLEFVDSQPWQLIEEVRQLFVEQARQRGLTLTVTIRWPLPASVRVDPLRLRQVLMNLVGNAIKFTERGEVQIELAATEAGTLIIAIIDSGIGMDEATRTRLFQPFEQADVSTTRRFGGSGLGLYISRALIARMGGEINVESTPEVGSRFEVRLPFDPATAWLKTPPDAIELPVTEAPVPCLGGCVLVAEDVEDLRTLIIGMVEDTGARALVASDGASALTVALFEKPDMVLLDIHMPIMDGVTVARRLRAEGYIGPIVALTADVLPGDIARYREAGCDRVLAKPVDRSALYAALKGSLPRAEPAPRAAAAAPLSQRQAAFEALKAKARHQFAQALQDQMPDILEADPATNADALRLRLHTLKGSAGTFGFRDLGALAGQIEHELRIGTLEWPARRDALLTSMRDAVNEVATPEQPPTT